MLVRSNWFFETLWNHSAGHRDAVHDLMRDADVDLIDVRPLQVGIRARERNDAEVLRHVREVDLAAGRQVDAARRALRDVVLVQIGPRGARRDVHAVGWVIQRCQRRGRRRLVAVVAARGRRSCRRPRGRTRRPRRGENVLHVGILMSPNCQDVRETAALRRLAGHLLVDVVLADAVGERRALERPDVLGVDAEVGVQPLLPHGLRRRGQQRDGGGYAGHVVLVEVGVRGQVLVVRTVRILDAHLDTVRTGDVRFADPCRL